ncbi:MAG: tRNA uridine-5-carboxymethylaminomethyl(34) synthesis GTPase MnmE [Oscillospiraceae bacterium]|nr:tRNA uridine-5-carboxymethylaminomethyl(34) synthesis GTPase MnmE [Oscillospiraceae bacterium]
MSDVIAAIATGKVPCAIGILRLSGPDCARVAQKVFALDSGLPLWEAPSRKLLLGTLHDRQGRVIDQAMAVCCRAPHSYTGEDTVELQCHGSPAMLAAGLEALFLAGARQAGPGEFTKRAFLNGQLDLTRAEAVIDLIDAETADAAANAAGQLGGSLLRRIDPVYNELRDLCSHFHAVLDYPDEDIEDFRLETLSETLTRSARALKAMLATYERGRHLKQGVRAVLLGRPNAGKSSLLNALAGYERVIVTEIAGTTRDTVEETVRLGRVLLRLTDTAGIRSAQDRIEALGVARSEQAAREAELAIFVCDGSAPLTDEDRRAMAAARTARRCVAVINKSDLPQRVSPGELPFDHVLRLSARTGDHLDDLTALVEQWYGTEAHCDGSILTNARQFGAITRAAEAIDRAARSLGLGLTPDAVLTDVEEAMEALGEVTGRTVREDITNRIFERFCVGK